MPLKNDQLKLLAALTHGSHDVKWADVVRLIDHLGSVEDHGHHKVMLRIGDEQTVFTIPGGKALTTEEMSNLKDFLKRANVNMADPTRGDHPPEQETETGPLPWIVVIDHHAARVYCASEGSRPDPLGTVRPADPHGFLRHLIHRPQTRLEGQRIPEDHAFYEEIAKTLAPAASIILVGHGTGASNAASFLRSYLDHHHSTIARRIVREETADLSALTEPQIEAIAKGLG